MTRRKRDQLELLAGGEGPAPVKRVRRAYDRTVAELRAGGRLEPVDTLLVAVGRTAADRCDELRAEDGKEFHEAAALRLMYEIAGALSTVGGPSDSFDQLLAAASGPTSPSD